jgi:hypothetical protein
MPVRWPSLIGINWFPGHMAKGMKQALKRAQQCDCIIEVHDARVSNIVIITNSIIIISLTLITCSYNWEK